MTSFVVLCVLLGIGHLLRSRIKLFHKLYLPSCVIGGLVGLLIIQLLSASAGSFAVCEQVNIQGAGFGHKDPGAGMDTDERRSTGVSCRPKNVRILM